MVSQTHTVMLSLFSCISLTLFLLPKAFCVASRAASLSCLSSVSSHAEAALQPHTLARAGQLYRHKKID